jgi:uncharacterized SAM-binding protein YcdF (DUF218 family)
MFFIKKLIESLLFPPGIIIFAFLLITLLYFAILTRKKTKPAGLTKLKEFIFLLIPLISLFSATCIYLLSIQPVSNMLLIPLETSYPVPSPKIIKKPSAIVVLSSGAYNRHTLGGDTFNRLFEGFKLYKKYHIPVIVSGGRAVSTFSLAKIMKNVLVAIGVDKHYVITEDKSGDTYQNAMYVLKICRKKDFRRIILVTSAYHMPRAMLLFTKSVKSAAFKNIKIKIIPYPADFKTNLHYNIYSYFPQLGYLLISSEALHEYIGYVYYYMKERL